MLVRMPRKRISCALLVGIQTGTATLENSMEVPQKIKNRTNLRPSNCTTSYFPRDTGVVFQRDTCTPMFIAALSTIAKVWKEPKCPSMDEWMKNMRGVCVCSTHTHTHTHTHNGVLLGHQKEWNLPTTWMELKGIMLSEIRERQKSWFHSYEDLKRQNRWT